MHPVTSANSKAPLLSWDMFCTRYNTLLEDAAKYQHSATQIRQIARENKWSREQTGEALQNIQRYVVVITDPMQRISFAGKGFYEMTGYHFEEVLGMNPRLLQGVATNKKNVSLAKEKLSKNESFEMVLENYRKNGELYFCKIIIKPIVNTSRKLVNYIAYEEEVAA